MAVITNQALVVACTPEQLFDYCVAIRGRDAGAR